MSDCESTIVYVESGVVFALVLVVVGVAIAICCRRLRIDIIWPKNRHRDDENKNKSHSNDSQKGKLKNQVEPYSNARAGGQHFDSSENGNPSESTERLITLQEVLRQEQSKAGELRTELRKEREAKEDALKRLSAIMSSRLRDGNPNVVDLNDPNRPVKIAEQFSELYDNQWTEAFEVINDFFEKSRHERDIIRILLDILEFCYKFCTEQSDRQLALLDENVQAITTSLTENATKLSDDLMQRIKEERKASALDKLPTCDELLSQIKEHFTHPQNSSDFVDAQVVTKYVNECVKICWLMLVQDPPMAMVFQPVGNANDRFKPYKKRGDEVDFLVWPAVLLEEEGALLMKGVAEYRDVDDSLIRL